MTPLPARAAAALLALLALAPLGAAHVVPSSGAGATPAQAVPLPPGAGVAYDELAGHGGARYYAVDLAQGQRARIRLERAPASFEAGGLGLVVMGPGVRPFGEAPSYVEIPENATAAALEGRPGGASRYDAVLAIEAIAVAQLDLVAAEAGRHWIVVHAGESGGAYAIAVDDAPSWGLPSWIGATRSQLDARFWEGQGPFEAWGAPLAGFAIVLAVALRLRERPAMREAFGLAATLAAGLFAASATAFAYGAWRHRALGLDAVAPTALLALAAAILAAPCLALALRRDGRARRGHRALLIAVAAGGFLLWCGFLWGPLMALVAAFAPDATSRPEDPLRR